MKRILTSLILAAGALAAFPSFAAGQSPLYYSAETGNTYRAYYSERGFTNASQGCTNKGGHLAVINSDTEFNDTIGPLLNLDTTHRYWLGASLLSDGTSQPVTVTGQAYFHYLPPGASGGWALPADGLTYYLDIEPNTQFTDFVTKTQDHFWVCEFEHAPI